MSHREQRELHHFNQLAESASEIWWGSTTAAGRARLVRRAELIAAALDPLGDPRTLEVGCGTGALTAPLLELRPALRLVAVDLSPRAVDIARARGARFAHAEFRSGSVFDTEEAEGAFDAVVGNSVLHHLPLGPFLGEAHRLLRPGGLLWFSEPNMLNPQIAVEKNCRPVGRWLQNSPDETAFFRWSLARILRRAGFGRVSVRPYDFLHPLVPEPLIGPARLVGALLERLPIVREVSGSLVAQAIRR